MIDGLLAAMLSSTLHAVVRGLFSSSLLFRLLFLPCPEPLAGRAGVKGA